MMPAPLRAARNRLRVLSFAQTHTLHNFAPPSHARTYTTPHRSGKGLYVNSPTAGTSETLPFYYKQVRVASRG